MLILLMLVLAAPLVLIYWRLWRVGAKARLARKLVLQIALEYMPIIFSAMAMKIFTHGLIKRDVQ